MLVTVERWGDSLAVRLPRPLLDEAGLGEGAIVLDQPGIELREVFARSG